MSCKVEFNYKIDISVLEKNIRLSLYNNGKTKDINFNIFDSGNSKEFFIETETLEKELNEKEIRLEIVSNNALQISKNYKRNFYLNRVSTLRVDNISEARALGEVVVKIDFSERLSEDTDYKGFVQVKPFFNSKLRVDGSSMYIYGDFKYAKDYDIKILEGLRSKSGAKLKYEQNKRLRIADIQPNILYTQDGCFLPTSKLKKIRFKSVNVKKAKLSVKKVYERNISDFLSRYTLEGKKNKKMSKYSLSIIGQTLTEKEIELTEDKKNEWIQSELDLSNILTDITDGVYIIEVSAEIDDCQYNFPGDWSYGKVQRYVEDNLQISKPLLVSDIGIIAKKYDSNNKILVTAIDVTNMNILKGC